MTTSAMEERKNSRGTLPIVKLSACLRFFAEGSYQTAVGKDHDIGLAQPSFCEVLSQVLIILEDKLCPQFIKMPTSDEKIVIAQMFFEKYRIPGVVGCVDGTHISIFTPSADSHLYYNRKGVYSLNVMLICDHDLRIRCVDALRPGSCHDSFIWNLSDAKNDMEVAYNGGERNYHLLGDSGYPLQPWLLTPFRLPTRSPAEEAFNAAHTKCRNIIERLNGVLKNRWRCLLGMRVLHYAPLKATQIVNVCSALHNLCIKFNVPFEDTIESAPQGAIVEYVERNIENENLLNVSKTKRLNIANALV